MTISLRQGSKQNVVIDTGELVSYKVDGCEVIHQKGNPGWRNSDTEMFPIIGPTAEAGFNVQTPRGSAPQDQHGLLRELDNVCLESSDTEAVFEKLYTACTPVRNSKFPAKSTEEFLSWPYDFRFRKTFTLDADGLTVSFGVSSEKGMPFMLGYHPAFLLETCNPVIKTPEGKTITIADVLAVGSRALLVEACTELALHDQRTLRLKSNGFRHFMCWTEVPNMVCIEPITFYPYAVAQENLHEGFDTIEGGTKAYSLRISVDD